MKLPIYQVDAFAEQPFTGNPAAVMPLESWLPVDVMQKLAMENNLAETAFFVPCTGGYELRWFTPEVEVPLCGHATLASAHVLYQHFGFRGDCISFLTASGELLVRQSNAGIALDFPAQELVEVEVDQAVCAALGGEPAQAAWIGAVDPWQLVYVYSHQAEVAALAPDSSALVSASPYSVIATAAGDEHDFVSRFFGPQVGVDEDPVTGSAHCSLIPYWAQRLQKTELAARQISERGGNLSCELRGDRVIMTGRALTYMVGEVILD